MKVIFLLIVVSDIWSSNIFIKNNSIAMQQFNSKNSCERVKSILLDKGGKLTYIDCIEIEDV